ncbi:caspase family protein [Burkholderia stagnalis]|uniref:caspase family protein n=1 Tax=Burkholderia stagnalis TaxID=1503054 RepID=UPI0009BF9C48|nr:caspase family protein [Burkholderia stagnalis]
MGINLAIVVGITNYVNENQRLSACANDVSIVQEMLQGSGKFREVFVVPSEDGTLLKSKIADFVTRYRIEEVDDLLFYFTGHGDFSDEEFRYLLRDYLPAKRAQTSLSNSELDNFLRSLNPKVVVKVVDACYSGMPYIKDGSNFNDYMKSATKGAFEKCYFLCSSQSDQQSWASEKISDFTKAFVAAIAEAPVESIRYKDVIDFIADAFRAVPSQRPLFVVQSDFTEVMGHFSEQVRSRLKERLASFVSNAQMTIQPMSTKTSLLEKARAAAKDYVSMNQAMAAVQGIKAELEVRGLTDQLLEMFDINRSFFDNFLLVPNEGTLGKWLSKNDKKFFASPTYETETYEVESTLSALMGALGDGRKITKTRQVISGVKTQIKELPFYSFQIILKPKLPNLTQYGGWFTYFLSKTSLQSFICFEEYKEVAWGQYSRSFVSEWMPAEFNLAGFDGGGPLVNTFVTELERFVSGKVASGLGFELDESDSEGAS